MALVETLDSCGKLTRMSGVDGRGVASEECEIGELWFCTARHCNSSAVTLVTSNRANQQPIVRPEMSMDGTSPTKTEIRHPRTIERNSSAMESRA